MKWLLGVMSVVAMSCGPGDDCLCSSLISISLGDPDYGVLTHPPTMVKLCLDAECHSFEVGDVNSHVSFPSEDLDPKKAMSVAVGANPSRLTFITELRHTVDTRDVKLEFSRSNQVLVSRTWEDAPFFATSALAPSDQQACVSSCTNAVINAPGAP